MDTYTTVANQYAEWVYPKPIIDMVDAISSGYWDLHEPGLHWPLYFPDRPFDSPLNILIAGCGTNQAAYYALRFPNSRVVGIDLSESSLAHQNYLKDRHGLTNLTLYQLNLINIKQLNLQFDLIISTGVIHHTPDPVASLKQLGLMLKPEGNISLMVYGKYPRLGVYMLQEVFRILGVGQSSENLPFVAALIKSLPSWHVLHAYLNMADDLGYDSGVVDTFLHTQDVSYSIADCIELTNKAGLEFKSWMDNVNYSLKAAVVSEHPLRKKAKGLSSIEEAKIVELIAQSLACQRFIVGRKGEQRPIVLEEESWDTLFPWLRHLAKIEEGENLYLSRSFHKYPLTNQQRDLIVKCTGTVSLKELSEASQMTRPQILELMQDLKDCGHMLFMRVRRD